MGVAATLSESTISSIFFIVPPLYLYDDGTIYFACSYTDVLQLQDKIYITTYKELMAKYLEKMCEWNVSIISCQLEIETITQLIFKLSSMKATKDWITEKLSYQECWKRVLTKYEKEIDGTY